MRESGGRIVLMDFGAGRESGPERAGADLAGTPVYMAPEVLDGGPASAASDLYSVGVLLFYSVTGDYPVVGESMLELSLAHRRGQRRLLADRRPDLPDGFIRAVERALSPSPGSRPASAGSMMRDLAGALPGSSIDSPIGPVLQADLVTPRLLTPSHLLGPAPPATSHNRAAVVAGVSALAVAGLGLLGFLTTAAFNQSLGRDATFSDDRIVDWWIFGAKSLVWPVLLAAVVIVAGRLAVSAWQVLRRLGRSFAPRALTGQWLHRTARLSGADSPVALSQWIVLAHVVSIAGLALLYQDLLYAVVFTSQAEARQLVQLSPNHIAPILFRSFVALTMVGAGAAWYGLLSTPERRAAIHRTTITAGAVTMVLALLMLVIPYRLLYHNEMPLTTFNGERCYETGARGTQVLLYCPDAPAPDGRMKIAERTLLSDPGITVRESIFSQASPPR
jgi:hypothetical protein